jgi:hypothetical protein
MFFVGKWGGKSNHLVVVGKLGSKVFFIKKTHFQSIFDPKHLKNTLRSY